MTFVYTCNRALCEDWSTTDREVAILHGAYGVAQIHRAPLPEGFPKHLVTAKTVAE